jgi:tetratricopeptide (TPR) repeat protein
LASASEALAAAIHEARSVGDRRLELRAELEQQAVGLTSDPHEAAARLVAVSERAVPVFEAVGDERALGRAWFLTGFIQGSFYCRNLAWEEALQRALGHYRRSGWPTTTVLQGVGSALFFGPRPADEALRRCDELLATEVSDRVGEAHVNVWRAALEAIGGEFDAAREVIERARHTYIELWQPVTAATSCDQIGGLIEMLAGDYEAAERIWRSSAEEFQRRGEFVHLTNRASELADALCAQGRYSEAEEWTRVAIEHSDSDDISAEFTWRSIRAKVLAETGDHDAAADLIASALTLVDSTDCLNQRANVRLDHARVLQLANSSGAAEAAAAAAALYDEKGNRVSGGRARRLAEELGAG